jgi:FkbM family methyltransferase
MISEVDYFGDFSINYHIMESHIEHAPMKATAKGHIWEKKLFHLYSQILEEDDIAIDIGAYIGTHTLPMSKLCSKVYSFEANSDIYLYHIKNIALNHIVNIEPHCVALSDSKSEVSFYKRDDGTSRISNRFQRGEPVKLQTDLLSSFINPKEKIKLIKIDCEGHEFQVLEGSKEIIKNSRPIILIEVFKNKLDKLTEWAKQNNYKIESIRGEDYLLSPNFLP